ncbi:MAG: substrate-binding domain-containing protein [Pseudolabrys sp.]
MASSPPAARSISPASASAWWSRRARRIRTSAPSAAFKNALLAAKSVAYIEPESGGSSGIYIEKLLVKLGIAEQIKPKTRLKQGGYVADLIANGQAELGIHQISEIVPVKGVSLVGPLPKEIQNTTTYAAGISASTKNKVAAEALIKTLSSSAARDVLKAKGMDPAS